MTPDPRTRFDAIHAVARDPLARYLARRCAPDAVEDCFQEVLTVAWRRILEIPVGDEVPRLIGVARRVLANHRRSQGRFARLLDRLRLADRDRIGDRPPLGADDGELAAALAALRPGDAELLRMWAWDELAPREIAIALGISRNAASIRLHRAKSPLRERLEREGAGGRTSPASAGQVRGVEHAEAW